MYYPYICIYTYMYVNICIHALASHSNCAKKRMKYSTVEKKEIEKYICTSLSLNSSLHAYLSQLVLHTCMPARYIIYI